MKVLIVGGGGREHALAWKAARSIHVDKVFVAPGNAGTAREEQVENVPIGASSVDELVDFAVSRKVGLTIVGPEAPLVAGIVDTFDKAGLPCLGPSMAASRLEGSKAFAKDFMHRHGIPTASYATFEELEPALRYIRDRGAPIVLKADGLAGGKGVIIAETVDQALETAETILSGRAFGNAGRKLVVEELLAGEEASFIVMADGEHVLPLATSQDHKARDNGDTGPNTGGMGAYSPAPVVTQAVFDRIMSEVIQPTVKGMAEEGAPYRGFLYAGLMVGEDGAPRVLEFNCRFGDPEAQPIMLRLRSDLVELCRAALEGALDKTRADWEERASLGVVMAAGGYPGSYRKGDPISGLPDQEPEGIKVFHAGTALRGGRVVTAGGRVLCVTALGETVVEAKDRAYGQVKRITWPGVYYRTDIGHRAVAKEQG
jgi:phosphoribosylamine--glycine ligase